MVLSLRQSILVSDMGQDTSKNYIDMMYKSIKVSMVLKQEEVFDMVETPEYLYHSIIRVAIL